MLTLYISKGSSALAPHILLEELGLPYRLEERPIAQGAHLAPDYLAINPKGRVPALGTPQGVITENPAILWYLAEAAPEAGLVPADPFARARVQEVMAYLCATAHVAFAHRARGHRWSDDPAVIEGMKAKVAQNMRDCALVIEGQYLAGPWVLGEAYSMADPYLFLMPRWMQQAGLALADFPKLAAHHAAMLARPATGAALAQHGLG